MGVGGVTVNDTEVTGLRLYPVWNATAFSFVVPTVFMTIGLVYFVFVVAVGSFPSSVYRIIVLLGLEDASVSVTANWLSCRPPLGSMPGLSSVGTLSVLNVVSAEVPSILLMRSFDRTRK